MSRSTTREGVMIIQYRTTVEVEVDMDDKSLIRGGALQFP